MSFRSDTQISEPADASQFNLTKDMNGFGWDPDQGLFIPTEQPLDYFSKPHVTDLLKQVSK